MLDRERRLCSKCGHIVVRQLTGLGPVVEKFAAMLPGASLDSPDQFTDNCPKCKQLLSLDTTFKPTPGGVQSFFSKAMSRGWVASSQTISGFLPGWKMYSYQEGLLKLTDSWYTTPYTNKSTGITLITYGDVLLWVMHYGGTYQDEAMPVLIAALMDSYQKNRFTGGRGAVEYSHKGVNYYNICSRNTFEYSTGTEYVSANGISLGDHTYECRWIW